MLLPSSTHIRSAVLSLSQYPIGININENNAAVLREQKLLAAQKHVLDTCGFAPVNELRESLENRIGLGFGIGFTLIHAGLVFPLTIYRYQCQLLCSRGTSSTSPIDYIKRLLHLNGPDRMQVWSGLPGHILFDISCQCLEEVLASVLPPPMTDGEESDNKTDEENFFAWQMSLVHSCARSSIETVSNFGLMRSMILTVLQWPQEDPRRLQSISDFWVEYIQYYFTKPTSVATGTQPLPLLTILMPCIFYRAVAFLINETISRYMTDRLSVDRLESITSDNSALGSSSSFSSWSSLSLSSPSSLPSSSLSSSSSSSSSSPSSSNKKTWWNMLWRWSIFSKRSPVFDLFYRQLAINSVRSIFSAAMLMPFETVLLRLLAQGTKVAQTYPADAVLPPVYSGFTNCVVCIARDEGLQGFYQGLQPLVAHAVVSFSLLFSADCVFSLLSAWLDRYDVAAAGSS